MGRKLAVLVGINKYEDTPLSGCVNDARDLYQLFTGSFAFAPDDVRVLLDKRATSGAILKRLDWLVGTAKAGDELVFAYSGHGARVRDRNGDELKDHLDECLVPIDFDWDDPKITDDVLALRFKRLPKGARLTVVLDCCHSGTATRELGGVASLARKSRPRFVRPPIDVGMRAEGRSLPTNRLGVKQKAGWLDVDPTMNHLLLAASSSDQTAADAEFHGRANGALTRALIDEIENNQGTTWLQVMIGVNARLKSEGFDQVAQLEGAAVLINGYPMGGR